MATIPPELLQILVDDQDKELQIGRSEYENELGDVVVGFYAAMHREGAFVPGGDMAKSLLEMVSRCGHGQTAQAAIDNLYEKSKTWPK